MKVITTNLLSRFWKNGVLPIKKAVSAKLDATKIVNNGTCTETGFMLDARQANPDIEGTLANQVSKINSKIEAMTKIYSATVDGVTLKRQGNLVYCMISKRGIYSVGMGHFLSEKIPTGYRNTLGTFTSCVLTGVSPSNVEVVVSQARGRYSDDRIVINPTSTADQLYLASVSWLTDEPLPN